MRPPYAVHPHEGGFCIRDPDGWYLIEGGEILTFAGKAGAEVRCNAMNTDALRFLDKSIISEDGGALGFVCIWRRGDADNYRTCTVGEWLSLPENQSGKWLIDGGWGGPPGPLTVAWDEEALAWKNLGFLRGDDDGRR